MLKEAMKAAGVTDPEYASDIADLLYAGEIDLKMAGVVIEGEINITVTETEDQTTGETSYTVTDNSTITDKAITDALKTFVRARFRSPADADRLERTYQLQRTQLANATGYTNFGEEAGA